MTIRDSANTKMIVANQWGKVAHVHFGPGILVNPHIDLELACFASCLQQHGIVDRGFVFLPLTARAMESNCQSLLGRAGAGFEKGSRKIPGWWIRHGPRILSNSVLVLS